MERFIIRGQRPLRGTIYVRGSKNAALPILASTILTKEKCKISNLPKVLDVMRMLRLLEQMGSCISWRGPRTVDISNKKITPHGLKKEAVSDMRASILLLGPLLGRFGSLENMSYPGGCTIGARSIETHLRAFEDLGAGVKRGNSSFSVKIPNRKKIAQRVVLDEFSVTATENLLMFLSSLPKKTQIRIAASEPHIKELAAFLSKTGVSLNGAGSPTIILRGLRRLKKVSHRIRPDYIEAGTFIIAALATGGRVSVRGVPVNDLTLVLKKLASWGADIYISGNSAVEVGARSSSHLKALQKIRIDKIQSMPHPGIATDLQPLLAVLAAQTPGRTLIHEPLYEKRLRYLSELKKMGASVRILDKHRASVGGVSKLAGRKVAGRDLRAGAALVVAGLAARGTTIVAGSENVDRGYENLDERLRTLGAHITRA